MEDDHNKTIMIRRPPLGESTTDASQASKIPAASKQVDVPPASKAAGTAWFKTPIGIVGLIVAIVAVGLLVRSMTK